MVGGAIRSEGGVGLGHVAEERNGIFDAGD